MICPLPLARVLRPRAAPLRHAELNIVLPWLATHGWIQVDNHWCDPLDQDSWPPIYACRFQTLRNAQKALTSAGWDIARGSFKANDVWASVDEVHKPGVGYLSLAAALRHEGLS